jgi:S1-C subfamily serine protease
MSARKVRCPECHAKAEAVSGRSGRYRCTSCDEAFEVHEVPDEADETEPPLIKRRPTGPARRERAGAGGNRTLLIALVVVSVLGIVGLSAAAYFALKDDGPKERVAADPPPASKPNPPKPPVSEPPKKVEPKKEEPKPPSAQEVVRRVKQATVYVRATIGLGQVDMGSGFFAGPPGFVVTNAHVVGYGPREIRRPSKVEVVIAGGEADERTLPAKVYGVDAETDLALLLVNGEDLPAPLPFGKAASLIETQEVVVYGYPFGELLGKNISVNRSSVSSLRKEGGKLLMVQLAGGLNPGNSGGPVTNAQGEVVGVSVAKIGGAEIAFAIPAEDADSFVRDQHRVGGRFEVGGLVAAPIPPVRPPVRPPIRPPVNPVDPPVNPPANPPIKLGVEVKFAAECTEVCVGGGGRFLIAALPKVKQLAVFDTQQSKVVKHLPMASETAIIAAGADKLVVGYPDTSVIQRWSLTTFEKELTVTAPGEGTLTTLCMGSDSRGPLYVGSTRGAAQFLDLTTFKTLDVKINKGKLPGGGGVYVRASADGTVFGMRDGVGGEPHTVTTVVFDGERSASAHQAWIAPSVLIPSPNGRFVYTAGAVYGSTLTLIHPKDPPKQFARPYIPSAQGYYYMRLDFKDWDQLGGTINFFLEGSEHPFAQLGDVEGVSNEQIAYGKNRDVLTPDRRVFFFPDAKLVASIPRSNDRLVLRQFDVEKELERSGINYLLVASRPPTQAVKGGEYRYELGIKSKKGGIKCKLDAGPDGMQVTPDGKLTWAVPADFAEPTAGVILTVSDSSGQEVFHTFRLNVKDADKAPR